MYCLVIHLIQVLSYSYICLFMIHSIIYTFVSLHGYTIICFVQLLYNLCNYLFVLYNLCIIQLFDLFIIIIIIIIIISYFMFHTIVGLPGVAAPGARLAAGGRRLAAHGKQVDVISLSLSIYVYIHIYICIVQ